MRYSPWVGILRAVNLLFPLLMVLLLSFLYVMIISHKSIKLSVVLKKKIRRQCHSKEFIPRQVLYLQHIIAFKLIKFENKRS